jgi:hypothetical protein
VVMARVRVSGSPERRRSSQDWRMGVKESV